MRIELREGLPFVSIVVGYGGHELEINDVLVDTGSAGTVLSADLLAELGLVYEPNDPVHRIQGVGGSEFVFLKRAESVAAGSLAVSDLWVEVGALDYGFRLDGILGTDFLVSVGAVVDLGRLELR